VDVVVVDSVAALVPRAEIEGEMGDSHVGLQARLMSQALRKLTGSISKSKTCVVFINQIRMQIGVMFGCMHYGTRVTLADGTSEKIGKIVNQRMPVEVLSYDPVSGRVEPRKVVNWFDNGPTDRFIQFEVEGGPSGRREFTATENHIIFTPRGERAAGELREGDEVLVAVEDEGLDAGGGGAEPSQGPDGRLLPRAAVLDRPALKAAPLRVVRRSWMELDEPAHRFDIEVEGSHTYLVDGVVVHNSPETTAGGRALKFYASVRLDIRRIATLKEGEQAIGNRTKVKVVKNKVAAPFREAEFDILYNEGISREGELLDLAIDKGVVQKAGTWLSFGDERIGQGRENARLFLKEHADVRQKIEAKLYPALGLRPPGAPTGEKPAAEERAPAPTAGGRPMTPAVAARPAPRPQPEIAGARKR
jgi:recombination protein RecA